MKKKKLKILYEDKYLLVVDKECNLLTISNVSEKEKTLYYEVSLYVKRQNKNNKIFIVHRLDKDTSGIVIFAKNKNIQKILQDNWCDVKREYLAIVNGKVKNQNGEIKSYLKETKTHLVYSSNNAYNGKLAITNYEKLQENNLYTLLKIDIKTGRHHQIRVHLNDIGHPIIGDKIYNKVDKIKRKRMYLHAYYIAFRHPITNEIIKVKTDYPIEFKTIIEYK